VTSRAVPQGAVPILAGVVVLALLAVGLAQDITASNTSRFLGNGRWEWTVYIKASPQVLREIDCVEYTLHPTFPQPVRRVCKVGDSRRPFGLTASGWGAFQIRIRVFMRGRSPVELTHELQLIP
jgi:transcription initiation factor IIF auxiliary subunit